MLDVEAPNTIYHPEDPLYKLLAKGELTGRFKHSNPKAIIQTLGLNPSLKSLTNFIEKKEEVLFNLDAHRGKGILAMPDLLPFFDPTKIVRPVDVVGSDIGGTNLRAKKVRVIPRGERVDVRVLEENPDKNLREECEHLPKGREFREFVRLFARELVQAGLKSGDALSVSFSFPLKPIIRTGEVKGVGALIVGAEHHKKGTPFFNASLAKQINGLRVDDLLLEDLKSYNVIPSSIVFGNDASNVARADVLHGGFVASTGANGTCIEVEYKRDGTYVLNCCNSEDGAYFTLDPDILGRAELAWAEDYYKATGGKLSLESIMAGRFLGSYFDANVRSLIGEMPWFSTNEVRDWFLGKGKLADARLVSALAANSLDDVNEVCRHTAILIGSDSKPSRMRRELLTGIAEGIMARGGIFAGMMGYFTITALPAGVSNVRVGVDSSVAEGSEVYRRHMESSFYALTEGRAELVTLDRSGPLSPAALGGIHVAAMMAQ